MAVVLEIKAVPLSGRQKIIRDKSGIIKCFLKNAPENGKANHELIKFFSKQLSLPASCITILQGAAARKKTIKFDTTLSKSELCTTLGLDEQQSI